MSIITQAPLPVLLETKDLALIAYIDLKDIPESSHRFEGGTAYFQYSDSRALAEMELFFADTGQFKTYHQKFRSKKSQIDAMRGARSNGKYSS